MKYHKYALALFLAPLLLGGTGWALGVVQVKAIDRDGGITHLQVKNGYYELEFAPEKGGTAISFNAIQPQRMDLSGRMDVHGAFCRGGLARRTGPLQLHLSDYCARSGSSGSGVSKPPPKIISLSSGP